MVAVSTAAEHPILVVEDDFYIRRTVCEVLEEEGIDVQEAGNGAEALALLKDGLMPAMVILDLMMPLMDGWQLLAWMRSTSRFKHLPVVITSAMSDGPTPDDVLRLRKPFNLDQILSVVREHYH